MQPAAAWRTSLRKAVPDGQVSTAKPEVLSMKPADQRTASSSSMMWIRRLSAICRLQLRRHQRKMKFGAAANARFHPDASAIGFHDRPANRKPQSEAFALG